MVGDGCSIDIWIDYWIPGVKPTSHERGGLALPSLVSLVSNLIDPDTKLWDLSRVRSLFPPQIVVEITKLWLSIEAHKDKLVWRETQGGRRNQWFHEGKCLSPTQSLEHAWSLLSAHQNVTRVERSAEKHTVSWCKPPLRVLKLNVDGAIFPDQHRVGVGIILRDNASTVLMAVSMRESEVNDLAKIELVAMLKGLQLCLTMDIKDLILESDSLLTVNQLNEDTNSWSFLGNIIKETKHLLTRFRSCIVRHIGCMRHLVAHRLARYAWHIQDVSMWSGSCPDFVKEVVRVDSAL
ncbi:hypothetical protein F2P56_024501 [Juglans regia]|uniref:Uncharacterized protein LOC108993615 n=2 Tax=Juglans regia TaxID=51240 RepID=A0A2I4EXM8_JUGRE|nr:uncharacterized protein LOC108993615 [Juglans regia]KAF5454868.1 hypothetical protein F2P56_024501 [Juglans regia]